MLTLVNSISQTARSDSSKEQILISCTLLYLIRVSSLWKYLKVQSVQGRSVLKVQISARPRLAAKYSLLIQPLPHFRFFFVPPTNVSSGEIRD